MHELFYSGIANKNLLLERTIKEALHELGHNYGLRHCIDWDCVMHASNGIEEVDIKEITYCNKCKTKVEGYNIVFDGYCITDNDPDYQCVECGAFIYSKRGNFYFEERDI